MSEPKFVMEGELLRQGTLRAKRRWFALDSGCVLHEFVCEADMRQGKQPRHRYMPTRVEPVDRNASNAQSRLRIYCCKRFRGRRSRSATSGHHSRETVMKLMSATKSTLSVRKWRQAIQLCIETQKLNRQPQQDEESDSLKM